MKRFWTWMWHVPESGGIRLNDWLTPDEKRQFESEPNDSASLRRWLEVAYRRRDAASQEFERGLCQFIFFGLCFAVIVGVVRLIEMACR